MFVQLTHFIKLVGPGKEVARNIGPLEFKRPSTWKQMEARLGLKNS